MGNLDGKIALVTGAGGMRGVDRATVLKLAAEGADLAITDVRRDASDLPPAELRQEWHSIDSVSDEVEALGAHFPTSIQGAGLAKNPSRLHYQRLYGH